MIAVACKQIEIVKLLIEKGADLNETDDDGWTCLMYARKGNIEMINLLLKSAPHIIDLCTFQGNTALMLTVNEENTKVAKLLIEKGANIEIQNKNGKSALDFAKASENIELVELIICTKYKKMEELNKKIKEININMSNHIRYTPGNSGFINAQKEFNELNNLDSVEIKEINVNELQDYEVVIRYKKDKNDLLYIATDTCIECVGGMDELFVSDN
jgi:ankyrin repeat protein